MLKIKSSTTPSKQLSEQDWMAEFRVGIMAPKRDYRAKVIMDTWTVNDRPVDWKKYIQRKLEEWS
jgi:hypothetical protein